MRERAPCETCCWACWRSLPEASSAPRLPDDAAGDPGVGSLSDFLLGAGLVDRWTGNGFVAEALGWLVGLAVAVVFELLAHTYYEVSVVLAMAAVGFVVGASLMVAIDVRWSWTVVLVGEAGGRGPTRCPDLRTTRVNLCPRGDTLHTHTALASRAHG